MKDVGFNFENSYTSLPAPFFHVDSPIEFPQPQVAIINHELAESLGLDFSPLSEDEQAALFCGNLIPNGSIPFSQAYVGHQFGNFTMLGDGRAHMLGEHLTPSGERFDIQFKGSGPSPYSRRGDGLAAIGPMFREYLISEAMHALGIPTTRSLAVATTGKPVMRERVLPGAVLTRVASSHIRVGTFEYAAATQKLELLSELLNYTLERHFPAIKDSENKALNLLEAVMEKQIDLITHWMRVGFIHGVMNTDNMAISGESIDFGPCAFMDTYDPNTVFSSIDQYGRYAYSNQPKLASWNLARLAEALLPLIDENQEQAAKLAMEVLSPFQAIYEYKWLNMMRQKLGLFGEEENDEALISDLLAWMHNNDADFTNTFRDLSSRQAPSGNNYDDASFTSWYASYQKRRVENGQSIEASVETMQQVNPVIIPRNHLVEQALDEAENGDLSFMQELLSALKNPYQDSDCSKLFQSAPNPNAPAYQTFCGT